ncbi:GNAT family N-acetyltransferase [Haloarchaeobius amylolyticus]|uniref:GNAT family N-acetyltransferase n=1 Tax=Haloarchaeobius amylolyticus TaxID=1198296 RepID=UPI002271774E
MSDPVTLRETTEADARAVQRVADAACHAVYDDILGEGVTDDIVRNWYDPERLVADDIEPEGRPFFVAAVDGTVVGFAEGIREDARTADLYRIYVHPDHWGDGVGSALLDRLERHFADAGVERLFVSVLADNDVGVAFYESVGFEHVETTTDEQFDVPRAEYVKDLD